LYEWETTYPEWKEAKKIGYQESLNYYESRLAKKADKKTAGELNAIIFALKTRFHREYGEQPKINLDPNGQTITVNFVGTSDDGP
jgi:hypothetical protein